MRERDEIAKAAVDIAVRSAAAQGLPTYVEDAATLRSVAVLLAREPSGTPP